MANFLDLIPELRDLIYIAVIQAELARPPFPSKGGFAQDCYLPFKCSTSPLLVNSRTLLLVNHQLHNETTEVTHRLKKIYQFRYKLDCMVVNERCIYLSWLSIRAFTKRVGTLEVNLRSPGECDYYTSGWNVYSHDQLVIPLRTITLLQLLRHFLYVGPTGAGSGCGMRIGELLINVVMPSPISAGGFRSTNSSQSNERPRLTLSSPRKS